MFIKLRASAGCPSRSEVAKNRRMQPSAAAGKYWKAPLQKDVSSSLRSPYHTPISCLGNTHLGSLARPPVHSSVLHKLRHRVPVSCSSQTQALVDLEDLPESLRDFVAVLDVGSKATGGLTRVFLLGTAHLSETSCKHVEQLMEAVKPKAVLLELCDERVGVLLDDEAQPGPDTKWYTPEVTFEGEGSSSGIPIPEEELLGQLRTRPLRPVTRADMQEDIATLMRTGLFQKVTIMNDPPLAGQQPLFFLGPAEGATSPLGEANPMGPLKYAYTLSPRMLSPRERSAFTASMVKKEKKPGRKGLSFPGLQGGPGRWKKALNSTFGRTAAQLQKSAATKLKTRPGLEFRVAMEQAVLQGVQQVVMVDREMSISSSAGQRLGKLDLAGAAQSLTAPLAGHLEVASMTSDELSQGMTDALEQANSSRQNIVESGVDGPGVSAQSDDTTAYDEVMGAERDAYLCAAIRAFVDGHPFTSGYLQMASMGEDVDQVYTYGGPEMLQGELALEIPDIVVAVVGASHVLGICELWPESDTIDITKLR